jgi:truncated hemoglobin YjbI
MAGMSLFDALDLIRAECQKACEKHPPMNSHHEAYAVIKEEFDEYWAEVMKRPSKRNPVELRSELVQTAAMCLRALADLC